MVTYKVIKRSNPLDRTQPDKHYALVVSDRNRDFLSLSRVISKASTISETDCVAVLNELELTIMEELSEGRPVKFGTLGVFKLSLSSKGVIDADQVTADLITKSRVLFYPSKRIRKWLKTIEYKKAS